MVAVFYYLDEEQDSDPHQCEMSDPDPHPHRRERWDPDPHQSDKDPQQHCAEGGKDQTLDSDVMCLIFSGLHIPH